MKSRVPANTGSGSPIFYKTLIGAELESSGLNITNFSTFESLFNRKKEEAVNNGLMCGSAELVSLAFYVAEYYLATDHFHNVSKEEVFDFMDYLSNLINPVTLKDLNSLSRKALRNKKNQRLNEDFLKRKEFVLIYAFMLYNFQNRFEDILINYLPILFNVATFDSITLIRRLAQMSVAHLTPSSDLAISLLNRYEGFDGEYIFNGQCSRENDYEILEALKKEGNILASVFIPSAEVNFSHLELHQCPKDRFEVCIKPIQGERVDVTFKEYDEIRLQKRRDLVNNIVLKRAALERAEYEPDTLLSVLERNIALIEATMSSYERSKGFANNRGEKDFRSHSDTIYIKLLAALKSNQDNISRIELDPRSAIEEELDKLKALVQASDWYELPVGSFSNGVTSQLSYKNNQLAKELRLKVINNGNMDFLQSLQDYASKSLLGESLSNRILDSAR